MDAAARDALKRSKAAGEAELDVNDVLEAMASTLVKKGQYVYHVDVQPDPLPKSQETAEKAPPRGVFYRNTSTFATQLPPPVLPKRCSCQYLCTGAKAVVKCLSCAMYDPKRVGFFCKLCYDARHPWYRVDHVYIDISLDESIDYAIKVAHRRAEMIRFERDGTDLLGKVKALGPVMAYVADDFKVESQLKTAGHTATKLETRINAFRRSLRDDVRKGGVKVPPNADEAAILLCKTFRGWAVRRSLSGHFLQRLRQIKHPTSGKNVYLDTKTNAVIENKPWQLLHTHRAYVQLHESHPQYTPPPKPVEPKPVDVDSNASKSKGRQKSLSPGRK